MVIRQAADAMAMQLAVKKRKKRLAISCLECRSRKEKCDRNVPGCGNCRKRNAECRWGDERDHGESSPSLGWGSEASDATRSKVARTNTKGRGKAKPLQGGEEMPSATFLDDSSATDNVVSSTETLTKVPDTNATVDSSLEGIESYASGSRFDVRNTSRYGASERDSKSRDRLAHDIASRLPSKELAYELAERHLELSHHAFYCVDMQDFFRATDELWLSLDALQSRSSRAGTSAERGTRPVRFDVLACLLMVLAASAQEMPKTYHIGLGLVRDSHEVSSMISAWLQDGLECIDFCHRQGELTLTAIQAICMYELWLADRTPVYRQTSLLDMAARSAAQLGLDRLSNDERDRMAWSQPSFGRPASSLSSYSSLSWGAARFYAKDAKSREIGRAVWYIISMLLSVTVTFYYWTPKSAIDSMPPGQLAFEQQGGAYNPFAPWPLYASLSAILQEWTRLKGLSEARGSQPDYEGFYSIHAKLFYLHEELPTTDLTEFQLVRNLGESAESYTNREKKTAQRAFASFLLQCKLLMLHRPFMGAGYQQPEKYGISRDTALSAAKAVIEGARRFHEQGWAMMSCVIAKHTLLQAALVIILDLFVRPSIMASSESRTHQRLLNVAIERLKEGSDNCDQSSVLHEVGPKLEKLLSACAQRRPRHSNKGPSTPSSMSPQTPPDNTFNASGISKQRVREPGDFFSIDQLDSQLQLFGRKGGQGGGHKDISSNITRDCESFLPPQGTDMSTRAYGKENGRSNDGDTVSRQDLSTGLQLPQQQVSHLGSTSSSFQPEEKGASPSSSWDDAPAWSQVGGTMDWDQLWSDIFSNVGLPQ